MERRSFTARGSETNKEGHVCQIRQALTKMPKQQAWGGKCERFRQLPGRFARRSWLQRGKAAKISRFHRTEKNVVWSGKKHLWIAPIDGKKKKRSSSMS